jgi:fatty-acid desaturase
MNKQAALGLAHGPGERSFDERESTQLNPQALVLIGSEL